MADENYNYNDCMDTLNKILAALQGSPYFFSYNFAPTNVNKSNEVIFVDGATNQEFTSRALQFRTPANTSDVLISFHPNSSQAHIPASSTVTWDGIGQDRVYVEFQTSGDSIEIRAWKRGKYLFF